MNNIFYGGIVKNVLLLYYTVYLFNNINIKCKFKPFSTDERNDRYINLKIPSNGF